MQQRPALSIPPHFGNDLALTNALAFFHQTPAVVPIGGKGCIIVLNDDQFTVTNNTPAGIHHITGVCGVDWQHSDRVGEGRWFAGESAL